MSLGKFFNNATSLEMIAYVLTAMPSATMDNKTSNTWVH